MNDRINCLLKQSINSDSVFNLFSDVNAKLPLLDTKFLEKSSKIEKRNRTAELMKNLITEQI